MRTIRYRPRAQLDIESLVTYIAVALKSPLSASKTLDALEATIVRVAELPQSGQIFLDSSLENKAYRRILSGRYWIYYHFDETTLTVWRVFHTSQDTDVFGLELLDD